MPARGLTRKITRKQARSYEISSPNPIGVTAIASVNGQGRYARNLKAARLALMKKKRATELRNIAAGRRPGAPYAKPTRAAARAELRRRGLSNPTGDYADRYARTNALLNAGGQMRSMMNRTRRRARRNYSAREMEDLYDRQMAAARGGGATKTRAGGGKKRLTKKEKARRAKAAASRRKAATRKVGRTYGKFRSLPARVGGRRAATYLYKGKGGKPKKIPLWAILGAKSKADFERRQGEPKFARRIVAAKRRRDKKAQRLLAYGDAFTPNRRRTSMKRRARRNTKKGKMRGAALALHRRRIAAGKRRAAAGGGKAKKRTGGRRKRRTVAQRRATARMLSARWGRRIKRRKAWRNKGTVAIPNKRRRRRARRNPVITQAAANRRRRRRKARRNPVITQAAANRRRRRRSRRNPAITQAAANRRRRRRKSRRNPLTQAAANPRRRRRRRSAKRNQTMYNANRRRKSGRRRSRRNPMYMANRRRGRRRARRNPDILGQITAVLKVGAMVLIGFVAHRGLTWVTSEKLLTQVEVFNTGALAKYRGLIGGAAVAGLGIALLAKFAPGQVAKAGVGMGVSFLHGVLLFALDAIGQPEIKGYFSAYPDAEGQAFHTMAGYGAYETLPPGYAGMGEYDYYNQYSGMGQLTQAAAGYGASMGEYFAPGVNGVGEYEAVDGLGSGMGYTDEGIHPNLHAAEQALTVAEAAAGIGDMPLQSTVNPYQIAAPIQDAPGGSRAGILQGPEGIFGG